MTKKKDLDLDGICLGEKWFEIGMVGDILVMRVHLTPKIADKDTFAEIIFTGVTKDQLWFLADTCRRLKEV